MDIFPLFGFIEIKNILIILHLIGVALGVGGALIADFMFMKTVRDGTISSDEFDFLALGGTVVWAGLLLLVLSGAGMFFLNPEQYVTSSKFITKMSIIGVLVVNAIIFHSLHIPIMKKHIGMRFASSQVFMKNSNAMLASGVVSIISWLSALALATFSSIPYSYGLLFFLYIVCVIIGLIIGFFFKDKFIPSD